MYFVNPVIKKDIEIDGTIKTVTHNQFPQGCQEIAEILNHYGISSSNMVAVLALSELRAIRKSPEGIGAGFVPVTNSDEPEIFTHE